MDLLTASTFFPLWSWKLNTGGAWEEQTTESGQFDMVFQTSIAQCPCRNLRAGQKDLLLWPCATFLTFLYALNYFLTHKSESSELVLQSCLWSSIRKSYVRFSGLGASYPAAFLNYLPHFSRTQMRKYHQNEGGKSQNCSDEEARQGEHELNRRWAQLCAKEERCLKIMRILGDNAQANRCKLFFDRVIQGARNSTGVSGDPSSSILYDRIISVTVVWKGRWCQTSQAAGEQRIWMPFILFPRIEGKA